MAINYDALPTTKPQNVLPKGFYLAHIDKAEMRTAKSGSEYLSLMLSVRDKQGHQGKYWDMLFDSDKELLRYKLQRFLQATQLELHGTFELKDLCKLINGKEFIIDLTIDDKSQPLRNTTNMFEHEIYYPVSAWAELTGEVTASTEAEAAPASVLDDVLDQSEY